MKFKLYLLGYILMCCTPVLAQEKELDVLDSISEIIITSSPKANTPWSSTIDTLKPLMTFQPSAKTLFDNQLGVIAMNGENFSQDLRLSIRGFGARAAFGIRGIRMYMDDIPLTTPDGTTQIDELSIYDIDRVQVIRSGLAASLGNAGGGAILMYSPEMKNTLNFTARINQFGAFDAGIQYAPGSKKNTFISGQFMRFKGKRDHSEAQNSTLYITHKVKFTDKINTKFVISAYESPLGQDPGALLKSEFDTSRYMANANNKRLNAGESVRGAQLGQHTLLKFNRKWTLTSTMYYRLRDFTGQLPIPVEGNIQLDRHLWGNQHRVTWKPIEILTFSLVHQLEFQRDLRTVSSTATDGSLIFPNTQIEKFYHQSLLLHTNFIHKRWNIEGLVKNADYHFGIRNSSRSIAARRFNPVNGMIGVSFKVNTGIYLFGQTSTSFELPTLNEIYINTLTYEPLKTKVLEPEKGWHKEIGLRSNLGGLNFELSLYHIELKNLLVNVVNAEGRTYFENLEFQIRRGLDIKSTYNLTPKINTKLAYSISDFFNKDTKSRQVLVPQHRISLNTSFIISPSIKVDIFTIYNSKTYLNTKNTDFIKPYFDAVLSLSWKIKNIESIFTISNLYNDAKYSNLRANSVVLRYYEAANPTNISFGIKYKI